MIGSFSKWLFCLIGLFSTSISAPAQALDLTVPSPNFSYIDQNQGAGDACGPVSLLNSYGSGSEQWQRIFQQVPGTVDRARIASVIKTWGLQPSKKFPQRTRWQNRRGISFEDLTVMSQEMSALDWKAARTQGELLFLNQDGKDERILRKTHKQLAKSFKNGLPPILSLRRFVFRQGYWQSVHGHFVTLTAMPSKLPRGSRSFSIRYLDPTGAREMSASISLPTASEPNFPCAILTSPDNTIGSSEVRAGEINHLALAGAIGAW